MTDTYREIYDIVVKKYGMDPNDKLQHEGHYITVEDYMVAVSERGGAFRIIPVLRTLDKERIHYYLRGAAARIISETLNGNKDFKKYYKKKLKKIG